MVTLFWACVLLPLLAVFFAIIALQSDIKELSASGTKAIEAPVFKCPYCRTEIVGVQELDLINHSMCITRAPEELATLRKEQKALPVKSQDEYFVDVRVHNWFSMTKIPAEYKSLAVYHTDGYYRVFEARVHRNGELISKEYGGNKANAEEYGKRAVTIDQQKRGKKS